jgi:hypothetical protein
MFRRPLRSDKALGQVAERRDIPTGLGWLVGPYLTSVPRESLTFRLATTRSAVLRRVAASTAP